MQELTYGGFWRRFAALWLDFLVLTPIVVIVVLADGYSRFANAYYLVPNIVFALYYNVYLVQRYGGTPGKLMMGLTIEKIDGSAIGLREALLRFLPQLLFSVCIGVSIFAASFRMTDADQALSYFARAQRRADLAPGFALFQTLNNVWVWSEFVVLLLNKKRRALHDFFAGTVVIRRHLTLDAGDGKSNEPPRATKASLGDNVPHDRTKCDACGTNYPSRYYLLVDQSRGYVCMDCAKPS